MGRYKTGPREPKTVSRETLSRLSDPAHGKFTSPSREARNDELFKKQTYKRETEEDSAAGTSFFLTEYQDSKPGAGRPPPIKSSFRSRLEQAARAAETIEEEGPMSPSGKRYTSSQRVAEGKRKARMMDSLLSGANAVRGARQSAKTTSQTRQAAARLSRVQRAAALPRRTTTGGSQMSRNRQAKVDSQASVMSGGGGGGGGAREAKARYDSRTGRVHSTPTRTRNRSQSRDRDPPAQRAGSRTRHPTPSRDRDRDRDPSAGRARGREVSVDSRPQWAESQAAGHLKERERRERLAREREGRRKVFAERKARNGQKNAFASSRASNTSRASNSSADNDTGGGGGGGMGVGRPVRKLPTGLVSGSRSAASLRRRPPIDSNSNSNSNNNYNNSSANNSACGSPHRSTASREQPRARSEQRAHKKSGTPGVPTSRAAAAAAAARRGGGARRSGAAGGSGTPLGTPSGSPAKPSSRGAAGDGPSTLDSEGNSSLAYSVSTAGGGGGGGGGSPTKAGTPQSAARQRLLERRSLPTRPARTLPPSSADRSLSRGSATKPPTPSSSRTAIVAGAGMEAQADSGGGGGVAATTKESKLPATKGERYRSSDREMLLSLAHSSPVRGAEAGAGAEAADGVDGNMNDVDMALKKAEDMSKALKNKLMESSQSSSHASIGSSGKGKGVKDDTDTGAFAALLATHAKRMSGQLASAQSLEENYKKLIGT
jgi:hypothetical protein